MFLSKSWDFWLEWLATLILIIGVGLTSFNVYPLNLYVLMTANLLWIFLAVIWKKISLLVVQIVVTTVYVIGIVQLFL